MACCAELRRLFQNGSPVLSLAPMQDITDLPFWRLMSKYGGADLYFTEFFRVTPHYVPEKNILRSILENPTDRPAVAQIIGNDLEAMARTARALEKHPVAAIDLNLGCPAPVVYRKCAGGGLLRDLPRVDALLAVLRDAVEGAFTVKTRIGFESPAEFDSLLEVFAKHRLDLLTVHGRTVAEKYGPQVHRDLIAQAVRSLPFPVQANGNVACAGSALETLQQTGAAGLMIGRGAIRNPWIFSQIRDRLAGRDIFLPTGRDVLDYIANLYEAVCSPGVPERAQVQKMKKYMNFLGEGLEDSQAFLHDIRRCSTKAEFFSICSRHLDHGQAMRLQP
ncbi:MAG: tRNA-dihydrouridine synthase family protein [bacterium]